MGKDFFDIAFIIPFKSRFFTLIRMFLKTTRQHFPPSQLPEIQIYGSSGENTLRILLRFNMNLFQPAMLAWFQSWIQALNIEVAELESVSAEDREAILDTFQSTSDVVFTGQYDLDQAVEEIRTTFLRNQRVRKLERFPDNLRVTFRTHRDFIGEYADNISSGGMFIRGRTDLPPRSRVEIVLELPGTAGEVKAIAEVVHVVAGGRGEGDQDAVSGCGIQFVEFLNDSESRLKQYIQRLSRAVPL